jgi:hypothetical protein
MLLEEEFVLALSVVRLLQDNDSADVFSRISGFTATGDQV